MYMYMYMYSVCVYIINSTELYVYSHMIVYIGRFCIGEYSMDYMLSVVSRIPPTVHKLLPIEHP